MYKDHEALTYFLSFEKKRKLDRKISDKSYLSSVSIFLIEISQTLSIVILSYNYLFEVLYSLNIDSYVPKINGKRCTEMRSDLLTYQNRTVDYTCKSTVMLYKSVLFFLRLANHNHRHRWLLYL